jgi:hypothetical protein
MLKFNLRTTFIALVMTASVAACGGGGGGGDGSDVAAPASPSLSSDIPASALASVDALIAFMNNLIDTGTNDTSEPILLGESVLPVSDTI